MSVAVFYVLAALVIGAALVAVGARSTRTALLGVMATDVLAGIMLLAAGAQLVGLVMVVAPVLCLLGVGAALRRSGHGPLLADVGPFTERWPLAAGVAAGLGILLVWSAAAGAPDTAAGGSGAALLTLLHYRSPITLVMALILVMVALGGALLIGRTGADERRLDQAAAQRRLREQRSLSRRQHRTAARTRRGLGGPP